MLNRGDVVRVNEAGFTGGPFRRGPHRCRVGVVNWSTRTGVLMSNPGSRHASVLWAGNRTPTQYIGWRFLERVPLDQLEGAER